MFGVFTISDTGIGIFTFFAKNSRNCEFLPRRMEYRRNSDENSVCPSVCLSVTRMRCNKTAKICPNFYAIRKII